MDVRERERLQVIADYQFGPGAGDALFPMAESMTVRRSASGRVRQVSVPAGRIVSVGTNGRLTLGLAGGRRLKEALAPPNNRVIVGDESEPFIRDGRSTFAKFVQEVDDSIRARDEVVIVHHEGKILGVGRAELDAGSMMAFDRGVAVSVREGAKTEG